MLLTVVAVIVISGVVLWAINSFIPMDGKIRNILNAVFVIVLVLWLLSVFGIIDSMRNLRIGKVDDRRIAPVACVDSETPIRTAI